MEVILREHVDNLGKRGEVVKVAPGYARNYLLPRKLALPVTDGNKKLIERERKLADAREAEESADGRSAGGADRADRADDRPSRRRHRTAVRFGDLRRHRGGAVAKGDSTSIAARSSWPIR